MRWLAVFVLGLAVGGCVAIGWAIMGEIERVDS